MKRARIQAIGTLSDLILATLEGAPLHGYAIARRIEERSNDILSFGEGTLYPALKKLESDGFIVGTWSDPASGGRPQRVYCLTPDGLNASRKARQAWFDYSRAVDRVFEKELQAYYVQ